MGGRNAEFSLEQAEEFYRAKTAPFEVTPSDPTSIKRDLEQLRKIYENLKFQYLEQDTRDKFIALLFSDDARRVTAKDAENMNSENSILAQELESLKAELEAKVSASQSAAEDVITLHKRLEDRAKEVEAANFELSEMEREFDDLVNAPKNESYKMLLDLNRMIDSQDVQPDVAIRIAETNLEQDKTALSVLEQEEQRLLSKNSDLDKLIQDLQNQLGQLRSELSHVAKVPNGHQDPEQIRAQQLRELNSVLQKLTIVPVEVSQEEENHVLSWKQNKVVMGRDLRIMSVSNNVLTALEIECVNRVSGDVRIKRLSKALVNAFAK